MRNFIKPGKVLTAIAPAGGAVSGGLYILGSIFGISATTAVAGDEIELETGGVWNLPKVSAEAWTFGMPIYATSAGILTSSASGNTKVGVAADPAGLAANTGSGLVRLNSNF